MSIYIYICIQSMCRRVRTHDPNAICMVDSARDTLGFRNTICWQSLENIIPHIVKSCAAQKSSRSGAVGHPKYTFTSPKYTFMFWHHESTLFPGLSTIFLKGTESNGAGVTLFFGLSENAYSSTLFRRLSTLFRKDAPAG